MLLINSFKKFLNTNLFVCRILSITDLMGDRTVFAGFDHNMTAPSLALQLINPDTSQFHGLTFGVSSFQTGLTPEVRDKCVLYITMHGTKFIIETLES